MSPCPLHAPPAPSVVLCLFTCFSCDDARPQHTENRSYYRGTDGCLLVYDITDRASFDALPRWLDEARTNSANPDLSVMLIANKADLVEK